MRTLVAGGSGTLGAAVVRALARAGHEVVATTRTPERCDRLRRLGATPALVDALDEMALRRALVAAEPEVVIHLLTALPAFGPRRAADLEPTNRLRDEGTRNLLRAALAARVRRIVAGSFAPLAASPGAPADDPLLGGAARAVRSLERQVLDAARAGAIEGIVLRYGLVYGPGSPATARLLELVRRRRAPRLRGDRGRLPHVHLDDAVSATVAALSGGRSGDVYDIVDDQPASVSELVVEAAAAVGAPPPLAVPRWLAGLASPYLARVATLEPALSNASARRALGWAPRFTCLREGLQDLVRAAAPSPARAPVSAASQGPRSPALG